MTSLVDEVGPGLSGIGQLRALIASGRRPAIAESLDFKGRLAAASVDQLGMALTSCTRRRRGRRCSNSVTTKWKWAAPCQARQRQ
jgi:hypothetical protein